MAKQQYITPSIATTGDTTGYMNVISATDGGELQVVTTGGTVNTIAPDRHIVIGDVLVSPGHYKVIPSDYHIDGNLTVEATTGITIGYETIEYAGHVAVAGDLFNCTGVVDLQGGLSVGTTTFKTPSIPTSGTSGTSGTGGLPVIGSLVAHYKADAGVTSGSGVITQWNDQSGNGYHLYTTEGNEPWYGDIQLNGVNVPNTVSGWTTDNTRRMDTSAELPDVGATGTIFIVGAQYAGETFYNYFLETSQLNGIIIARNSGNQQIAGSIDNSDNPPYLSIVSATDSTFYTIRLTGDGTNSRVTLNGTIAGSDFPQSAGSVPDVLTLFYGDSGRPGKKAIAEILIYSDLLTTEQITAVEDYLVGKWNHY